MQKLWVPGPLPGLNDWINAKAKRYSRFRSEYTSLKERWDGTIALLAQAQRFQRLGDGPHHFVYIWRERDKRRDPSNVIAGGRKTVEDGLQAAGRVCDQKTKKVIRPGLLAGDGWRDVASIQDFWLVDKDRPGVTVFVLDEYIPGREYWVEHE